MNTPDSPDREQPRTIPQWQAYLLFAVVWGVLPWGLSLLTPRYGWADGRPGSWNLLGLILVTLGLAGSIWGFALHFGQRSGRLDWELDKDYLLTRGPHAFSRNPMYLSELTLMLGWVVLYGNIVVLLAFLAWWALFVFYQVPLEEKVMQKRFGETYLRYKRKVPRWFGIKGGLKS
jgi:protein-S-isoprenylcysteine O-methyltransferase Ste14